MRVLQIRLKNLNSLKGEWLIDLSDPAYVADGLFAITGPTGAGKTTILDALTLALYGETPRLGKLSQSENEILARQAGECFAEVIFETQAGKFCCHWSQRRARGRPDGELQAPKHEVSELGSKKILSTKLKETRDNVEKIIGMDFSRFTRSVLLAQGGFAAFLSAPPSERAPILEEITGTEIYSKISVAVHERLTDERARLDALLIESSQIQLLSEDEEVKLRAELVDLDERSDNLEKLSAARAAAAEWLRTLDRLDKETERFYAQMQDLQGRVTTFAQDNQRRLRAQKAQEVTPAWVSFDSRRKDHEELTSQSEELQKKLPLLAQRAQGLAQKLTELGEQNLTQKKLKEQILPVIRRVRELDVKIHGLEKFWLELEKDGAELNRLAANLGVQRENAAFELARNQKEFQLIQNSLGSPDALLVDSFGSIQTHLENLSRAFTDRENHRERLVAAGAHAHEAQKQAQEFQLLYQQQKETSDQLRLKLNELQEERLKTLDGQTPAQLRERSLRLQGQKNLIEQLQSFSQELSSLENSPWEEGFIKSQNALKEIEASLESLTQLLAALESKRELLVTQLDLIKTVESYEEARRSLQDGQPCPLCGSLVHPGIRRPRVEESMTELQKVRAQEKDHQEKFRDLQNQKISQTQTLMQFQTRREEALRRQNDLKNRISQLLSELAFQEPFSKTQLDVQIEGRFLEIQGATALLIRLDQFDSAERLTRGEFEDQTLKAEKNRAAAQSATTDVQLAEQALEQVLHEAQTLDDQLRVQLNLVLQELSPLGIDEVKPAECLKLIRPLELRRQAWLENQNRKIELEKGQALLEQSIQESDQQLVRTLEQKERLAERSRVQKQELENLQKQRKDIFADRDPDVEERRQLEAFEVSERAFQGAQNDERAAVQAIQEAQNQSDAINVALLKRAVQVQEAQFEFQRQLGEAGFGSEQEYLSARLSEGERQGLEAAFQNLEDERKLLETRLSENVLLRRQEAERALTTSTLEAVLQEAKKIDEEKAEVFQKKGGGSQTLAENQNRRARLVDRQKELDRQKNECDRWAELHSLVGSADGKRFRTFAQGLTFEIMIDHANLALQKMTDRYVLIPSRNNALDLSVIDTYQGGEERSTKNLSGGEGFLVSLALALGLSHMSSQKVRVDSLFLDEGFGTLDENALDTALATLSALQQDGKLIGIISHVPAIKERISAQIVVTPRSGGQSALSGPGVSKVS